MLTYDLSKRNGVRVYEYLYRCISGDILEGKLAPGEKLPSKRALARHLNIAVITVVNAYEQLMTEGYIFAVEKKGYFVSDLRSFRFASSTSVPAESESAEPQYFADFRANRTSLKLFPATVWSHYMREALSLRDDSLLKTVPYKGLYQLRRAISEYLAKNRGIIAPPSRIIIGAGTEYLYSRLIQLFGRTCTFASEDPGYKKFAAISSSYGNPWEYIPIDENGLMIDRLEESGADVIHVSPSNHFPTGIVMPIVRRAELLEWAARVRKRYIIEDDYDSEFRYSGHLILPIYAQDSMNKIIYMNTFSKSLVPSLRISYMILPQELMERYQKTMSFYSCTVSSFEQYALSRFISDGHLERHINRMRSYYRKQRALILDSIAASPLANVSKVLERSAGTHFLLKINTALSEEEIRAAAKNSELAISLYSDYSHAVTEENRSTLVINYAALESAQIPEIVRRMSEVFPECHDLGRL